MKQKLKLAFVQKALFVIIGLILAGCLAFSLREILLWQGDTAETKQISEGIERSNQRNNLGELKSRNPDTVAWLSVPGTNIDYPVVQTYNNDYYLDHSFDKKPNQVGWVFADYRNDFKHFDQNTIIYGHNSWNNLMFGSLKKTLEKNWYSKKENHVISVRTESNTTKWQVFSVYHIKTTDDYLGVNFDNAAALGDLVNVIKKRSVHDFNVSPKSVSKILTLSTCHNQSERVVVHARLVSGDANADE